jgi:hypothetical protein
LFQPQSCTQKREREKSWKIDWRKEMELKFTVFYKRLVNGLHILLSVDN